MTQQGDVFLSYVDKEMTDWRKVVLLDTRGCSITITYFPPTFIFSSATVQYGSFCLRSLERLCIAVNIFIVENA